MLTLKTILATIFVPGTACILVPYLILRATNATIKRPTSPAQVIAILVILSGIYMIVWVSTTFVRQGRGTPVPVEPPTRLIIKGLYRYVRNPMYVGAVLVVLGEALYFRSIWLLVYAIAIWAMLHAALLVFEERQLKERFGPDYEQYLRAVPRWIPKIPGRDISR